MTEETLLDRQAVRLSARVVLRGVPNESTILRFRHLLDAHDLGEAPGRDQLISGRAGPGLVGGHHRRRCHSGHVCFHRESAASAGGGDALGQEGQPVALRHETALRRGCGQRSDAKAADRRGPCP